MINGNKHLTYDKHPEGHKLHDKQAFASKILATGLIRTKREYCT